MIFLSRTGMQPPAWLAQMPQGQGQNGEMSAEEKAMAKQKLINGHK